MATDPQRPTGVQKIGVLGAGTMGAGIAQVAAENGFAVLIHDPFPGAADRARVRIDGFLGRKVEKGQLSEQARADALDRLSLVDTVEALAGTDLVIEAIPEELALKRGAFRRLDAASTTAILASNTSSLSIAAIADGLTRPGRVIGLHFFNPVPLMALVEVIPTAATDRTTTEAAVAVVRRLGKTPVLAADTPGFIVNRVARPFYLEALRIVGERRAGVAEVDAAMRAAGFRMGPFELIDTIGADVNLAVSLTVFEAFAGAPRYRPHPIQEQLVAAGRLGRKSGAGFYNYAADGTVETPWSALTLGAQDPPADPRQAVPITARILATIVNEAASAVEEGVATPDAVDTAMRLGTNYPRGPLAWGEAIGLPTIVATLDALHAGQPDGRYAAVPLLRSLAQAGDSFFVSGA